MCPSLNLCDQLLQATCFEGWQSSCHLIEDTAKCPDVRLVTVDTLIVEKLWRHVVRRAILALGAAFLPILVLVILIVLILVGKVCKLTGKAKVTELERTVFIEEHIRRFEVTVDNAIEMEIVETLSQISAKLLYRLFRKLLILFDQLEEITSSTVLKDDPEMVPGLIPVVEFENVSVLEIMEDSHLSNTINY